jgi:hypothetical protein
MEKVDATGFGMVVSMFTDSVDNAKDMAESRSRRRLSSERHVPAIPAAAYRRNVTLLRLSRWNVTLWRCRCR